MCRYYQPLGDPMIRYIALDGTGYYASAWPVVMTGSSKSPYHVFPPTAADSASLDGYWPSCVCPCTMCRSIYG
ncbi:hypothetical protein AtNW77_Chr4g0280291 [Arabidopsis thaliana]